MTSSERWHELTQPMTCDDINEKVFKFHNYNGAQAYAELDLIARADQRRQQMRNSLPLFLGITAFSGYNLSRMGVLSASGRVGAGIGFVTGAALTVSSLMQPQ